MYRIDAVDEKNRKSVVEFITKNWGAPIMVTRGKVHHMDKLSGFAAMDNKKIIGLITYNICDMECEIVSLDSIIENQGIGTLLLSYAVNIARKENCKRIWLITTNDNTRAIRFYQKRGFDMKALYHNAVCKSRKVKPEIPSYGIDDIPILHEIEFEMKL